MEMIFVFLAAVFTAAGASTCGRLHQIRSGDTCLSISSASNLTLPEFLSINPAINCSHLAVRKQVCTSPCFRDAALPSSPAKRAVLMDYIGAMDNSIRFTDVPIAQTIDHYFILSFAIDANRSGIVQNGNFISYWSDSLDPQSVLAIKSKHPNVKVLLSLAGYSLAVDGKKDPLIVQWYDPADVDQWIDNAVKSISSLVQRYHLDGVDIDYESMNATESRLFPFCIGEVIKALKTNRVISIATVAPYGDSAPYYRSLLRYYGDLFDYVNFQFYSFDNVTNASQFLELYHDIATKFDRKKLLVSLEINGRGIQGAEFFKAVKQLGRRYNIPGMFLWSAEGSKATGFLVEKVADCTL